MYIESEQKTGPKGNKSEFRVLPISEDYPFEIEGIVEKHYIPKEDEKEMVERSTGELFVMKSVPKTKEYKHDSLRYTKFFQQSAMKLRNLSVPASNMLYLVASRLEVNYKHVCLTEEDFIKHCGYGPNSRRLYYKAITELAKLNIIRKKAGFARCYWVNANVIFNGDRTKIV